MHAGVFIWCNALFRLPHAEYLCRDETLPLLHSCCSSAQAGSWDGTQYSHYRRKYGDSRCWDGTIIFFEENFGDFGDQWDETTGETTPPWDGTSPNLWIYYGTPTVCNSETAAASIASSRHLNIALLHLRAWEAPGLVREGAG